MNIKQTINKLQKSLIQRGYIYKINTYQFYSEQKITERQPYQKKNGEMSVKDVELLNSCSQVEVLKWFVEKWKEVRENESDS